MNNYQWFNKQGNKVRNDLKLNKSMYVFMLNNIIVDSVRLCFLIICNFRNFIPWGCQRSVSFSRFIVLINLAWTVVCFWRRPCDRLQNYTKLIV